MKLPTLKLCKQQGFTLLESLIALLIFAIVILGSGLAISRIISAQKEMHVNFIITNLMQTKLQNALSNTNSTEVCSIIDLHDFNVGNKTYHIGCSTEKINVNSSIIEWPVLAVSTNPSLVQPCAEGTPDAQCYIVGR